ncbi:MAG: hypothetical protein GF418_15930 [Chitinivibrionales bacterium]|nr:hypothetical protein [Chitinivibrionales bacterium]
MPGKSRKPYTRSKEARTWIPGVPAEELYNTIWHFDGVPSALRSVFHFAGAEEVYLDDVNFAAILAYPFRFWFSHDWASCLAYTHEEPIGVIVANTLGYDYLYEAGGFGDSAPDDVCAGKETLDAAAASRSWETVKQALDAGNPVIVFGGDPAVDPKAPPVVVTGYDENKDLVFFLPHATWEAPPKWKDSDPECRDGIREQGYRARKRPDERCWVGNGFAPGQGEGGAALSFFVCKERVHSPNPHEVALSVVRRAVGLGRGRLRDHERPYRHSGLQAFDLLAECLEQDGDRFKHQEISMSWEDVGKTGWWFAMEALASPLHRKAASLFLERCAGKFGGFTEEQNVLLWAAAGFYVASSDHFGALWDLFLSVGPLETHEDRRSTVALALMESSTRKRAAEIVRYIRATEEKAISFLERVLALEPESKASFQNDSTSSPVGGTRRRQRHWY